MEKKGYLINYSTNNTEYFVLRSGILRAFDDPQGDVKNSMHMAFCTEVNLLPKCVIELRCSAPCPAEYVLVAASEEESETWYSCLRKSVTYEQTKIRKNIDILREGAPLIKYNYSNSKRTRRVFWISTDGDALCWARQRDDAEFSKVDLKECIGLVFGPMTTTFVRCSKVDDPEWCCFSLLFMGRTLDLATPDGESMVAPWLLGIQYLVAGTTSLMSDAQFIVRKAVLKLSDAAHRKQLTLRTFLIQELKEHAPKKGRPSPSPPCPPMKPDALPAVNGKSKRDEGRVLALEYELREAKLAASLAMAGPTNSEWETAAVMCLRNQCAEKDVIIEEQREKVDQYDALVARSEKMEKALRKMAKALEKNDKASGYMDDEGRKQLEQQNIEYEQQIKEMSKKLHSSDPNLVHQMENEIKAKDAENKELRDQITRIQRDAKRTRVALACGMGVIKSNVRKLRQSYQVLRSDVNQRMCKEMNGNSGGFSLALDTLSKLSNERQQFVEKIKSLHDERRKLHNLVLDLKGNMRVFCRVRPMIGREHADEPNAQTVSYPEDARVSIYSDHEARKKSFEFDRIFHPSISQVDVFAEACPLATSVLDGYNVCIFAYGQTGSGKTFTMVGSDDNPGLNVRILQELFALREQKRGSSKIVVILSIMEIYNETLRDLLCAKNTVLDIKATDTQVSVPGLEEKEVDSQEDVLSFMHVADTMRASCRTDMNEHSSRSHSIVTVKTIHTSLDTGLVYTGKMHLIDLAGSENVGKSGVVGARLTEAQNINKSLSALGDVMQALQTKTGHIPYRNSKLTMLLKDSLGGNSKTLMIPHISPAQENVVESLSTLNFASRAKQVELGKAKKNVA